MGTRAQKIINGDAASETWHRDQRSRVEKNQFLINTKLNRPVLVGKNIHRSHLMSFLEESLDGRITIISAPAGFGKTTLAVQWLDQCPIPSAWVSLDSKDSDPDRFLTYIVSAMQTIVPDFGKKIKPMLSANRFPAVDRLADAMIQALEDIDHPVVLVIDDYQALLSMAVHQVLAGIVECMPHHFHLMILSRMDPPWPLARWHAKKWLKVLRQADLSFKEEETRSYFQEYGMSDDSIKKLHARTEGWPAALRLLELTISEVKNRNQFIASLSSSDYIVVNYLMDEVVSILSPEIRRFLNVAVVLERFCVPLCDFIFTGLDGAMNSRQMIERIEAENLFVVPLDHEKRWYRFHHLFQDLLKSYLREDLTTDQKKQVHRLAGEWFADEGLIKEGLQYLIEAEDYAAAGRLFYANMHAIIQEDFSRRLLGRLISLFPVSLQKKMPVLLVAQASRKIFHWDFDGIKILMDAAEENMKEVPHELPESFKRSLLGEIHTHRSFVSYWQGDGQGAFDHAAKALDMLPLDHQLSRQTAILYYALSKALLGHRDEVLQFLDDSIRDTISNGIMDIKGLLLAKIVIFWLAGNLDAVETNVRQFLLTVTPEPVDDFWRGYAYFFWGCIAYERNDLDKSETNFTNVEKLLHAVSSRVYHDSLIGLALVALARANEEKAKHYSDSARLFAIESNDSYSYAISDSFEVRYHTRKEKNIHSPWRADRIVEDNNMMGLEKRSLTRAEWLIANDPSTDLAETLRFIEKGLQTAKNSQNIRQLIQFMAIKSVALKRAEKNSAAIEVLTEALDMGRPFGYVRSFADRGPVMAVLLQELLTGSPEDPYMRQVYYACKTPVPFPDKPSARLADPELNGIGSLMRSTDIVELTNREMDILILLEKRLSNKEIAQKLFVSPETIKKHTSNLYRKLDVNGRRQAVVAAKRAGLLE